MAPSSFANEYPQTATETTEPRFSVLAYPERLNEILELRRVANAAADQLAPDISAAQLLGPRELAASNVVAEINGRLVGTVRLAPPIEGFLLNHANPTLGPVRGLPKSSEYLETAWAAVHPKYHGRGILWRLAAHMVITAQQCGKPFLVGGCNPSMWRFWQRCGYRETGIPYIGRNSPYVQYSVILMDVEAVLAGRGIAPQLAQALAPLLDG